MTWPLGTSGYPLRRVSQLVHIQLGKMLQPLAGGSDDREVSYLRAGHLGSFPDESPRMWASQTQLSQYGVEVGDLLVAEGGDAGRAEFAPLLSEATIIQNSLHRLRPRDNTDIRFVRYCLHAVYHSGWLEVLCNKSTFGHLTYEKLAALLIPSPSIHTQRATADFLDAETARIDALTAKKRHMIDLLDDRRLGLLTAGLRRRGFNFPDDLSQLSARHPVPLGWMVMHLSVALRQLTNGYVGPTRDLFVDEGVRYIQSLHIKDGSINFDRRPYFVPAPWHCERPRIHLLEGDVVIVQTGDIGQVAVVPPGFGEASCHALQIARVRPHILSGAYLAAYLQCPFGKHSLMSRVTGALHPHLEGGIRDAPIVVPPRDEQQAILDEVEAQSVLLLATSDRLRRQIALLGEHRQALITAAVTGELDVPGVAA